MLVNIFSQWRTRTVNPHKPGKNMYSIIRWLLDYHVPVLFFYHIMSVLFLRKWAESCSTRGSTASSTCRCSRRLTACWWTWRESTAAPTSDASWTSWRRGEDTEHTEMSFTWAQAGVCHPCVQHSAHLSVTNHFFRSEWVTCEIMSAQL